MQFSCSPSFRPPATTSSPCRRCSPQLIRAAAVDSNTRSSQVLVAGATGGVGVQAVKQLVESNVAVTALVRDLDKAKSLLPSETKLVKGDLQNPSSFIEAFEGIDAVICALGPTNFLLKPQEPYLVDEKGAGNLVNAAVKEKVRKFVLVSSIGAGTGNPIFEWAFWGVLHFKRRGEEFLERSGLDYTIIRPAGLRNEPPEGSDGQGNVIMMPSEGLSIGGVILRAQVAECCIAAISEPAASNKIVEVMAKPDAPPLSYQELFKAVP